MRHERRNNVDSTKKPAVSDSFCYRTLIVLLEGGALLEEIKYVILPFCSPKELGI